MSGCSKYEIVNQMPYWEGLGYQLMWMQEEAEKLHRFDLSMRVFSDKWPMRSMKILTLNSASEEGLV